MTAKDCFNIYLQIQDKFDKLGITNIKKVFSEYSSYPKDAAIEYFGEDIIEGCLAAGMLVDGYCDSVLPQWDEVQRFEDFVKTILLVNALTTKPESKVPSEDEEIEDTTDETDEGEGEINE